MLKTLILPEVVAQEGWRMSQCLIELVGLVGSVLHLPILARTIIPFCDKHTAGSRRHLGQSRKKAKWPPVSTPLLPAWSLHSSASCMDYSVTGYPFRLGWDPKWQTEPYCCWFVSMQLVLSGGKKRETLKSNYYTGVQKKKGSCLGLKWDQRFQCNLKMQKTWKR